LATSVAIFLDGQILAVSLEIFAELAPMFSVPGDIRLFFAVPESRTEPTSNPFAGKIGFFFVVTLIAGLILATASLLG